MRNPEQVHLLIAVVDSVHDLIENKGSEADLLQALRTAFTEGGVDVWANAEKWLQMEQYWTHKYSKAQTAAIWRNFHLDLSIWIISPRGFA